MSFFGGFGKFISNKFKKFSEIIIPKKKKIPVKDKPTKWEKYEPQYFKKSYIDSLFKYRYVHAIEYGYEHYGIPAGFSSVVEWMDAVYYWNTNLNDNNTKVVKLIKGGKHGKSI